MGEYSIAKIRDGWCVVNNAGEIVAGPYGYRAIAHQEMMRLNREGK